jgi:hypothetical protein
VIGSLATAALVAGMTLGSVARADDDNDLTPQDSMVTTIIDKSVINGGLMHDDSGNLVYDNAGNARFAYTGDIFALKTNGHNGELKKLGEKIGTIKGEAAFPKDFVAMSAGVNALMDSMMNGTWDGKMPKMPSVVPWTCNHCYMVVDDSTYVSIVDALDPASPFYSQAMADKFDAGLMDGAAGALANMRMQGRAFTGLTPASFDPVTKTMSVRMAGCSALVAISGSHAGKVGTLCMNSTATFNVSGAKAVFDANYNLIGYEPDSQITANGSSNCITVLHKPTM